MAQLVKKLPAVQETQVQSLGGEDPLGKEMAAVLQLKWFTGPRVDEARPGKLEEDPRCYRDCRRVYFLWAAAVSLQGLLRHQTDKGGPWPVGTQAQCCQGRPCSCLQNIRYEAMREGRKTAWLTPCCQILSPQQPTPVFLPGKSHGQRGAW